MIAPDLDHGAGEPLGDLGIGRVLGDPLTVFAVGVASVHAVVPGDDDVVEVEIDGDTGVVGFSHG